jgi:hypothetical protein
MDDELNTETTNTNLEDTTKTDSENLDKTKSVDGKKFSQDEVNKFVSNEKRKLNETYKTLKTQYDEAITSHQEELSKKDTIISKLLESRKSILEPRELKLFDKLSIEDQLTFLEEVEAEQKKAPKLPNGPQPKEDSKQSNKNNIFKRNLY